MVDLVLMSFSIKGDQEATTRKPAVKNVGIWYDMADFANIAAINTKHDNLATDLDAITGGVIQSSQVQIFFDLPGGLKGAPLTDHLVQKGALLNFDLAGSSYSESIWIPAIRETLILDDNVGIAISEVEFSDLAGEVSAGTAAIPAVNKFGVDFGDIQSGVVAFRR